MTDQEIDNLIAAQFAEWEQSHGALFNLGVDAACKNDHDTFVLAQLLLVDLPPEEED